MGSGCGGVPNHDRAGRIGRQRGEGVAVRPTAEGVEKPSVVRGRDLDPVRRHEPLQNGGGVCQGSFQVGCGRHGPAHRSQAVLFAAPGGPLAQEVVPHEASRQHGGGLPDVLQMRPGQGARGGGGEHERSSVAAYGGQRRRGYGAYAFNGHGRPLRGDRGEQFWGLIRDELALDAHEIL